MFFFFQNQSMGKIGAVRAYKMMALWLLKSVKVSVRASAAVGWVGVGHSGSVQQQPGLAGWPGMTIHLSLAHLFAVQTSRLTLLGDFHTTRRLSAHHLKLHVPLADLSQIKSFMLHQSDHRCILHIDFGEFD